MPSDQVFSKFKRGKLHSGSKRGKKVTSKAQATAIYLSEKRKEKKSGKRLHARKVKRSSRR